MNGLFISVLLGAAAAVAPQSNDLSSFQAFQKAAAVLRHPRCMNCHVPGDAPLFGTGASAQPHAMRVKRGVDGGGTAVLRCNTCHQETNAEVLHGPPGSKEWRLPAAKTKMAWLGLSDRELCRAITDAKTNGGMTRETLMHHMETDPRVAWAWNPGPGRETPLMSQREFVSLIRTWIEKGAACGQ